MAPYGHVTISLRTVSGSPVDIDHAALLAEYFFRTNPSSVGTGAYDAHVLNGEHPDRITVGDIAAVNRTMAARTAYSRWTDFTDAEADEEWLDSLDPTWDLFETSEPEWLRYVVHRELGHAFKAVMGPYRGPAVVTKVLHIKRPRLIPICDSYVARSMGVSFGENAAWRDVLRLVMHLRKQGQANLDGLLAIQQRLQAAGYERTLVRILDALLWMHGDVNGPNDAVAKWLHEAFDQTGRPRTSRGA